MPRKVVAYACQFKCGERVNTKKEAIRLHENICFSNPARRACRTCKYFDIDEDGSFCKLDEGGSNIYIPAGKFATFNCPYWRK